MKYWWPIIILFSILVISVGTLYATGYRIGPNISLVKTHTLTITDIPKGASIFADYVLRSKSTRNTASISLVPGMHTILVSAQNYSPWASLVAVPESTNVTVRAIMIPKAVSGTLLSGSAARKARAFIKRTVLPTIKNPLVLAGGCALVSVSANYEIIATPTTTPTCTPPPYFCIDNTCTKTVVFPPEAKLSALVTYPNRNDALLAVIGKNIFAISLDPRAPRTFVSILHGIAPHMAQLPDGAVVVYDQSAVYSLSLAI